MALARIHEDGQVSLPVEIQRAVGLEPGDVVSIDVTAQGTVEIRRVAPLRLADALRRYRVEGPIDDAADREDWQDAAARDVLGSDVDA
jgi:bifunctional DNA-binding transcriptional regulator/antitoxin component of YhaV-PrlF toxin-antitoxin module